MKKPSLNFLAFLQALGVLVYCGLVSYVMLNGNSWFGPMASVLGPLLFLTLFVASALVTGSLVLGFPIKLFWIDNKKKEAINLLVQTTLWILVFVTLLILILFLRR